MRLTIAHAPAHAVMLAGDHGGIYAVVGSSKTGWGVEAGVCWPNPVGLRSFGGGWGWDAEAPLRPWPMLGRRKSGGLVAAWCGFMLEIR